MNLRKKICSIILSALFLLPMSGLAAEKPLELIYNGSFEETMTEHTPEGWTVWNGEFGSTVTLADDGADGEKSLRINKTGSSPVMTQVITGLWEGAEYEINAKVKVVSANDFGFQFRLVFYDTNRINNTRNLGELTFKPEERIRPGRWTSYTFSFTVPQGAVAVRFMPSTEENANVFFDDISVVCKTPEYTTVRHKSALDLMMKEKEALFPDKEPLPGTPENLLENPGFEDLNPDGSPKNWEAYKGWNGGWVRATDKAYSGNTAVVLTGDGSPWVNTKFHEVEEGVEYQFSCMIRVIGEISGNGFGFKIEGYTDTEHNSDTYIVSFASQTHGYVTTTGNEWMRVAYTFRLRTGLGIKSISVRPRMHGTAGIVYVDDVCLIKTAEAGNAPFSLLTDDAFYYSDRTRDGVATAYLHYDDHSDKANYTVDFALTDGDKVLKEEKGVTFGDKFYRYGLTEKGRDQNEATSFMEKGHNALRAFFYYSMDLLSEKQHDYVITATVRDPNGNVAETFTQRVAKYDRPSNLREDGVFLKDGKPFVPKIHYHLDTEHIEEAVAAGFNTISIDIQTTGTFMSNPKKLNDALEIAEKYDLMLTVGLYHQMDAAGSIANYEKSQEVCKYLKDNDRILYYLVMDEPQLYYAVTNDDLYNSYRVIRDNDPDTPVAFVDVFLDEVSNSGRFCDVLLRDCYPAPTNGIYSSSVRDTVDITYSEMGYEKPVGMVLQTYEQRGGYLPSLEDIRFTTYQSFFGGAKLYGYFSISDALNFYGERDDIPANSPIFMHPEWEQIKDFMMNESVEADKAFITGEYPTLYEHRAENVWYKLYKGADGLYLAVLNVTEGDVSADIPIRDFDGNQLSGNFTARRADFGDQTVVQGTDGVLHVDVPMHKVQLYKINAGFEASSDGFSFFKDLNDYDWARTAITSLYKEGVLNSRRQFAFEPGENVTRGEFAMFLVRALGLTGNSSENFADVDPDAEYAKELAIGKGLGIFKGVNETDFAPENVITRQDLMVLCDRAFSALGKTFTSDAASDFTDSGKIAEYAVESVKRITAAGILRGNADGTLNPLGNTTRAEAAVIIGRIS